MAAEHRPEIMTVDEYFELERNHPERCYEYIDGYAYMMAGGSFNHDTIKSNIQRVIGNLLAENNRCNVYSSDMKTQIAHNRYYHPDVVISCDPRDRGKGDLLKYPKVIFEILSPSTEMKDRTQNLRDYLALPTLEEYILVDSASYRMEMYRKEPRKWAYYIFWLEDELALSSVDLYFPVAAAYNKVIFEQNAEFLNEDDEDSL